MYQFSLHSLEKVEDAVTVFQNIIIENNKAYLI